MYVHNQAYLRVVHALTFSLGKYTRTQCSPCTSQVYSVRPQSPHRFSRLNSRDFLSNYSTGKSGYGATPSKISPIHPSALTTPTSNFDWPSERGFPSPNHGLLPDMQYVLDIRAAGPGQVQSHRGIPCDEDSTFTDRTSEMSIELRELRSMSKRPSSSESVGYNHET